MNKPRVLVFGCGPSGLISAYAAQREFGAEVVILSVKRPSQLYGCQYLHEPIPGVTRDGGQLVRYGLAGTYEDYRAKQYGSLALPVSPQQYEGDHIAWDLRQTYADLWEMFESKIQHVVLKPEEILPTLNVYNPDYAISSVPLPVLCQRGYEHTFNSVRSWAIGDSPEQDVNEIFPVPPFTVMCDGTEDRSWYRACNVFGYTTIEWPGHKKRPPIKGVVDFEKPISATCDCFDSILRVGRYGRWQKGVLSHEAYQATVNRMAAS